MAPSKDDPAARELITLFTSIGLTRAKAAEAAKSAKSAAVLKALIETHDVAAKKLDEKQAGVVVALAITLSKVDSVGAGVEEYIVSKIADGDLKSIDQVNGEIGDFSLLSPMHLWFFQPP